jgi:hypothetical protein
MLKTQGNISKVNIRVLTCLLALVMFGAFSVALHAASQESSPPGSGIQGRTSVGPSSAVDITAVVVKSWDGGSASAWGELNTEWPAYGSTSIYIDTATLGGVGSFTYQDLVNTGADVVILSDPAGGVQQYSRSEIAAVSQYASEGHNVIGTFSVFQWGDTDNRGLAPIFGLRSDLEYDVPGISNVFNVVDVGNPLFTGIPDPWTSTGYPYTQTPANDLRWDSIDLAGARFTAECDSYRGMISVYNAGNYTGIYISNMPEYYGGSLDKQLLYNAITYQGLPTGAVNGYVTDANTGNAIQWAFVIASQKPTKKWTLTNPNGYYEIADLPAGDWWVIVIKKGYKAGIAKVVVNAGETTTKDFQLKPNPE